MMGGGINDLLFFRSSSEYLSKTSVETLKLWLVSHGQATDIADAAAAMAVKTTGEHTHTQ